MNASAGGAPPLSVPALLEEATARTGLDDWGDDLGFTATLGLLLDSCRETADLTPSGWDVLHKVVLRHLRNRLYIEAAWASDVVTPAAIEAPIVITGLPRTGTTLLHNLLALDPAHRVLRFWEALHPVPPDPDRGTFEETLVAQADTWLERLYALAPSFRAIHEVTAKGPEECDALLQNAFASQHFDDMFRASAYSAWLNHSSLVDEYAYYVRQLRLLAGTSTGGRRWVLKSPSHLGYLETLLASFPGAVVVLCHRDPCEAIASYASLVMAVRAPYTADLPPASVGRHALDRSAVAVERALAARDREGDGVFVDVAHRDLVRDPLAVVRDLYARVGQPLGEERATAMEQWLAEHPRYRHGRHRYSLEQFGLSPREVRERLAGYAGRFPSQTAPTTP